MAAQSHTRAMPTMMSWQQPRALSRVWFDACHRAALLTTCKNRNKLVMRAGSQFSCTAAKQSHAPCRDDTVSSQHILATQHPCQHGGPWPGDQPTATTQVQPGLIHISQLGLAIAICMQGSLCQNATATFLPRFLCDVATICMCRRKQR